MRTLFRKPAIAVIFGIAVFGAGALWFSGFLSKAPEVLPVEVKNSGPKHEVIGQSVLGRAIDAYTYSSRRTGENGRTRTNLLFVGGIHGGYEWNSVILAYQFMDYLEANPEIIPDSLTVTVIPSANPDGVYKVVGKEGRFTSADVSKDREVLADGRFNANDVDLNRNFDCKWKPNSTWKSKSVSAGSAAFSEPEAEAIRSFVSKNNPTAVIFWHSQANAVYASECKAGILPETLDIMNAYSRASGYPAVKSFDSYEITGDAEGWLASKNIPAITVELKTHETVEFDRNLAGIKALFGYYGSKTVSENPDKTGEMVLGVGRTKQFGNLKITLDSIVQDSRCPVDVTCVWAGLVEAKIKITNGSKSETVKISSVQEPYLFEGFKISIISVAPFPESGKPIASGEYLVTFKIAGL
jgi:predicted deacylase